MVAERLAKSVSRRGTWRWNISDDDYSRIVLSLDPSKLYPSHLFLFSQRQVKLPYRSTKKIPCFSGGDRWDQFELLSARFTILLCGNRQLSTDSNGFNRLFTDEGELEESNFLLLSSNSPSFEDKLSSQGSLSG